jgi:hypothetical protein
MRFVDRFEYKYALDIKSYHSFKNQLMMFMKHGHFTEVTNAKRYFVRSLYYDTYDFKHYLESEEGMFGRIKCRIRTYHQTMEEADIISVEIKAKHGSTVKKYSQLIDIETFKYFLDHKAFNQSSKVLDEFTRLIHQGSLEPKVIVEYEREGYVPRDDSDFRLTFDFNVRSGQSKKLFEKNGHLTRKHNQKIVCEIKCGMDKPEWLESMVKTYGLKTVRNSKYIQAIERMYPGLTSARDN